MRTATVTFAAAHIRSSYREVSQFFRSKQDDLAAAWIKGQANRVIIDFQWTPCGQIVGEAELVIEEIEFNGLR